MLKLLTVNNVRKIPFQYFNHSLSPSPFVTTISRLSVFITIKMNNHPGCELVGHRVNAEILVTVASKTKGEIPNRTAQSTYMPS